VRTPLGGGERKGGQTASSQGRLEKREKNESRKRERKSWMIEKKKLFHPKKRGKLTRLRRGKKGKRNVTPGTDIYADSCLQNEQKSSSFTLGGKRRGIKSA